MVRCKPPNGGGGGARPPAKPGLSSHIIFLIFYFFHSIKGSEGLFFCCICNIGLCKLLTVRVLVPFSYYFRTILIDKCLIINVLVPFERFFFKSSFEK